jgi:signal transduction histidine kinase
MTFRFRTLSFGLFLLTLCGFLAVFSVSAYHSAGEILKQESANTLSQSALTVEASLMDYLQIVDRDLQRIVSSEELGEAFSNRREAMLNELIIGDSIPALQKKYHFVALSSLDRQQCYLIKSRLMHLGSDSCASLYQNYVNASFKEWNVFRNAGQVIIAKDFLVKDPNNKVVGRLIGGIKLSGNSLLLNQLVSRVSTEIEQARFVFTGVTVSQYNAVYEEPESNAWFGDYQGEHTQLTLSQIGGNIQLELSASGRHIRSLYASLSQLFFSGAIIALLISACVAALLSMALDNQLQAVIGYIRDLVSSDRKLGWEKGKITEFNRIGEQIDDVVHKLYESRLKVNLMNQQLEATVEEKRSILHQLIQNQEQERNHLAQELHDELGQLLTAVRVETVLLEHQTEMYSPALKHSAKIKELVADMYETVYDRIMALRPTELDTLGLRQSILQIPTLSSLKQMGVNLKLDLDEVVLPEGADIHLYRIVQEALTNAMKHSLATEMSITLKQLKDQIWLNICDNGESTAEIGAQQIKQGGFGLLGIRERCEYLGATLEIGTDVGFCLDIHMPLDRKFMETD